MLLCWACRALQSDINSIENTNLYLWIYHRQPFFWVISLIGCQSSLFDEKLNHSMREKNNRQTFDSTLFSFNIWSNFFVVKTSSNVHMRLISRDLFCISYTVNDIYPERTNYVSYLTYIYRLIYPFSPLFMYLYTVRSPCFMTKNN